MCKSRAYLSRITKTEEEKNICQKDLKKRHRKRKKKIKEVESEEVLNRRKCTISTDHINNYFKIWTIVKTMAFS